MPSIPLPMWTVVPVSFASFPEAKGFIVVFTCNHCPFAVVHRTLERASSPVRTAGCTQSIAINPMDRLVWGTETR